MTDATNAAVSGKPNPWDRARTFQSLHERPGAFIVPNPWDVGSARLLMHLGFEALATTSMGYAFSRGRPDNSLNREETLAYSAAIVSATDLPVTADLENGFGSSPSTVSETIRLAAATGLAGGSIEDATGDLGEPIYPLEFAVERIRAAADAARLLRVPFVLTARAENYLHGRPTLADTIQRLQAYQEAGADVLYAPGLTRAPDIETVVRSVDRPLNVVMGLQGAPLSRAELSRLGVKRISVGSALYRSAMGEFMRAAHEMRTDGTFTFADRAERPADLSSIFAKFAVRHSA